MRFLMLAAFATLVLTPHAFAQEGAPVGAATPDWFSEYIDYMTRNGGRWATDNTDHRTEDDPVDAWVMVFSPEFDGASLSARLFSMTGDIESIDYWLFDGYWDAARGEASLVQTGWGGALGIGPIWQIDETTIRSEHVFSAPEGPVQTIAHIFVITGPDEHITRTETRVGDGDWIEGQSHTWVREG